MNGGIVVSVLLFWVLNLQIASCLPVSTPQKRVGQTLTAATTKWKAACESAGGGISCTTLAEAVAIALISSAGSCGQQDTADTMINLANNLGSPSDLIALTQIYIQQPRNSDNALSVPYCQRAPKNSELQGLFQCQFKSSSSSIFTGNLKVGAKGTIPYGLVNAVKPSGGCPAHPSGPITDGVQLVDFTSDPGLQNVYKHRTASSVAPSVKPTSPPSSTVSFLHKSAVVGAPRPTFTITA